MFNRNRSSIYATKELSSSRYTLTIRRKRPLLWVAVIAVLSLGAVLALQLNVVSPEQALRESLKQLTAENERLKQDSSRILLDYQHEVSIREGLEKELAAQAEEIKNLRKNLSFYRGNVPQNQIQ